VLTFSTKIRGGKNLRAPDEWVRCGKNTGKGLQVIGFNLG